MAYLRIAAALAAAAMLAGCCTDDECAQMQYNALAAFTNGYNAGRPHQITCYTYGNMTQCQ